MWAFRIPVQWPSLDSIRVILSACKANFWTATYRIPPKCVHWLDAFRICSPKKVAFLNSSSPLENPCLWRLRSASITLVSSPKPQKTHPFILERLCFVCLLLHSSWNIQCQQNLHAVGYVLSRLTHASVLPDPRRIRATGFKNKSHRQWLSQASFPLFLPWCKLVGCGNNNNKKNKNKVLWITRLG